MAKKITIYQLEDKLPFGKHKGYSIRQILQNDPSYLLWCSEKLERFAMSDEAWDYAVSINANFSTLRPKPKTAPTVSVVVSLDADGIEILTHYPWKDCAAARTKFMAYARQIAEEVALVVECHDVTPIQLTLF